MSVTDRSVVVAGSPRRRGRPRVAPSGTVSTWMPVSYHERLIALARAQDVSVSALVRQLVVLQIRRG